jgi:hypothetical protein
LVLEDNLSDSSKQGINITKASLRPGRQYFTAKEAEAGDPLIINNEEDSSTSLEDRDDDSDESFDASGDDDDMEDHIME